MESPRTEEPDTQQPDDFSDGYPRAAMADDGHSYYCMEASDDDYFHERFSNIGRPTNGR